MYKPNMKVDVLAILPAWTRATCAANGSSACAAKTTPEYVPIDLSKEPNRPAELVLSSPSGDHATQPIAHRCQSATLSSERERRGTDQPLQRRGTLIQEHDVVMFQPP